MARHQNKQFIENNNGCMLMKISIVIKEYNRELKEENYGVYF